MRRYSRPAWLPLGVLSAVLATNAWAGPEGRPAPPSSPGRALSPKAADRFMQRVIDRERNFYRPGVGYDAATGMTFDGHALDPKTGALLGAPRNWSAASKESLHLMLLSKALDGDRTARALLTPDPRHPSRAVDTALDVLGKKIASYEKFDREYPGFGGFLPWYKIEDGKVAPTADWADRVPGLDNGQLAWSMYRTADALRRSGHVDLAKKYEAHLDLMKRNVVDLFYDPVAKKMRAEAKLVRGSAQPPNKNRYQNNIRGYFLNDAYEGLLLCHFADLFGDWRKHPQGKDQIWKEPRRKLATFVTRDGAQRMTVVEGNWFSSHEDWGFLVLPYRDVGVADRLFMNAQKARTAYSREHGWPGLFASTTTPVREGSGEAGYLSALGIPSIAKEPVSRRKVFSPYAAFPLALADRPMFATWLRRMLSTPRMWGPNGIGESFTEKGQKIAPILTWDGKALPLVAWMGGIGGDVAKQMKRDGVYDAFIARVKADYARFDGADIEGEQQKLSAPARSEASR